MINIFKKGIRRQIILPMIITMISSMIIIYAFLIHKNETNIINSSVIFAKNNIEQYLTLRQYYSSNIVDKIRTYTDLEVNLLLDDNPKSIPLPATMIHDLSELLKNKKSHIKLNLYSSHPFPTRENRVLDTFEKDSLLFLANNPTGTFFKREIYDNQDSVRVVVADVLSDQTCVSCHNNIANTPKNSWKLGDVRGALEIIIPIEAIVENNFSNTIQTIILLFSILFISILIIYLLVINKFIQPIEEISEFVNEIKNGNLSSTLHIYEHNELKLLSDDINLMTKSLKETLDLLHKEICTRKKAENELGALNNQLDNKVQIRTDELKNQNEKLKKTLIDLETTQNDLSKSQKMANLGELVGGITHEINTPLGISITTASYIESLTLDLDKLHKSEEMTEENFENFISNIVENIKTILSSLNRVTVMVKSFKDIALDQVIEEKRVFNLEEYINEVLISIRNKTKKYKHNIELKIDKDITINSYPGYFYQVFTNLINNSYLHAFEGIEEGEIQIIVSEVNDSIKLIYKDNGVGVNKEIADKIFNEYFTTKKGKGGTGLGLSIINNLITQKLNGTIEIQSKEQSGLEFTITIPKEIKT